MPARPANLKFLHYASFFQNGLQAKSGIGMCFDIGSGHRGCWGQNTSRIQNKQVYAIFVFAGQRREFRLAGMRAGAVYAVHAGADCAAAHAVALGYHGTGAFTAPVNADAEGVVRFHAFAHCGVSITLQQ